LPATQGLQSQRQQQASCPAVNNIPPTSECTGRASNCWSVGQPDVDCIDNAICCFDGCANVCQGAGSRSPAPPPNPRPVQQQGNNNNRRTQQKPAKKVQQKPRVQKPKVKKDPWPQATQQQPANDPWPQQQQRPKKKQQPRPRPVQQQPRPQNNFQQSSSNAGNRNVSPAASKPFVRCPSAMKCVPKVNCNLEGVMVNEVLNYTPDLEMLRVPLIPCVNMAAGNVVDVCCRDPNYQDPWPDMNNGGIGNNGGGGGYVDNSVNARAGRNWRKQ